MIYRLINEMDWLGRFPSGEYMHIVDEDEEKSQWANDAKLAGREKGERRRFLFSTTDRINGYLNDDQSC